MGEYIDTLTFEFTAYADFSIGHVSLSASHSSPVPPLPSFSSLGYLLSHRYLVPVASSNLSYEYSPSQEGCLKTKSRTSGVRRMLCSSGRDGQDRTC